MWMDDDSDYSDEGDTYARRRFESLLQRVKENDPDLTEIDSRNWYRHYGNVGEHIENMTDDDWEDFGRNITNNTHLEDLQLHSDVAGEQTISSLFRGLTGSNSIKEIRLYGNDFGVEGVRSMMPFLQNASNLKYLNVSNNNIGSEGFALLWTAVCDRPIEELYCSSCGIDSFEIDGDNVPKKLRRLVLPDNNIGPNSCRELARLLQGADSTLTILTINGNDIGSEGFSLLWRVLCDSQKIEELYCVDCGIESVEMDGDRVPKKLKICNLNENMLNEEGCRGLAKSLRGKDCRVETLRLERNNIDDEGVAILVNALQDNKSLKRLHLIGNESISNRGEAMLLKLVNDITSIKATLKSNHTLEVLEYTEEGGEDDDSTSTRSSSSEETNGCLIQRYIKEAIETNNMNGPGRAGRKKVIETQLDSVKRSEFCRLQGVDRSLYSEINPLHLPEVLSLVGRRHGQKELFVALKSSVADLISTVNRKQCIQQQMAFYEAKLQELGADLAAIEEADRNVVEIGGTTKRRRI